MDNLILKCLTDLKDEYKKSEIWRIDNIPYSALKNVQENIFNDVCTVITFDMQVITSDFILHDFMYNQHCVKWYIIEKHHIPYSWDIANEKFVQKDDCIALVELRDDNKMDFREVAYIIKNGQIAYNYKEIDCYIVSMEAKLND